MQNAETVLGVLRSHRRAGYSETGPPGSEGGHAEKDQPQLAPRCVADPTQTLQREMLDDVKVWPDLEAVQAAVDSFRVEYNTNRPHQSLGMAFPADRFTPRPTDTQLPLRLPPVLAAAVPVPAPRLALPIQPPDRPQETLPAPLVLSTNGLDPVDLAVEVIRVVPASGNLTICGQQFWLGPDRAGTPITFWADTTVVHLLHHGIRLKTLPSRLTPTHLRDLLAADGHPAGPPPITTGTGQPGAPIEVDRLVNATGLIGLAGRQHSIGYYFAGRRVSIRIDHGVMQVVADGVLLRSLPNPLAPADLTRIRDARPAGPPPQPAPEAQRVQRRVSCRGAIAVAHQRIHVGMTHTGRTLDVEAADTTFRVYDVDQLITEVGSVLNFVGEASAQLLVSRSP